MEPQAECMLVVIGATPEGRKKLGGFQVGVRESAQSWRKLLVDLKTRGLAAAPCLATGDGSLGFWKALRKCFRLPVISATGSAKAANVPDKLPKSVQPAVRRGLREISHAPAPPRKQRCRRSRRNMRRNTPRRSPACSRTGMRC